MPHWRTPKKSAFFFFFGQKKISLWVFTNFILDLWRTGEALNRSTVFSPLGFSLSPQRCLQSYSFVDAGFILAILFVHSSVKATLDPLIYLGSFIRPQQKNNNPATFLGSLPYLTCVSSTLTDPLFLYPCTPAPITFPHHATTHRRTNPEMTLPLVLAATLAAAPASRHEVTSFPGYDGPLPSKAYSGFIPSVSPPSGKGEMYFHYLMFEAEENPATAPTVFWYNGGPGASSLFGLFLELGPLYLNEFSETTEAFNKTGIPTPLYNPKTWSKRFNLFAIDSPAPVGFSYCTQEGPAGKGTSCGSWNDTYVFKANHAVVTTLMNDVFPELKQNKLYIAGESYAGVYVPGLVNELITEPKGLNLAGYIVGDGVLGNVGCEGPLYDVEFFGGHGQISNELYNRIRDECPRSELCSGKLTAKCEAYIAEMTTMIGGYYVYDLYDDCQNNMFMDIKMRHKGHSRHLVSKYLGGALNDYACTGSSMTDYLNRTDVREAFGVPTNDFFFNADNGHGFNYTSDIDTVMPFHKRAIESGLRVLTYQGDADACGLNSEGFLQEAYTSFWPSIGLKQTETWRPWTVDGKQRMGGYAMEWGSGQAAFLTIRGSGHMVPLNKPDQAFTLINSFVFGEDYPRYQN